MGGDLPALSGRGLFHVFQSTPPGWEATTRSLVHASAQTISIHASRMGGDPRMGARNAGRWYFNPRLPDGRRPSRAASIQTCVTFQSTPPGWEATVLHRPITGRTSISIHASRMGGDLNAYRVGRLRFISIHASRMGGDAGNPLRRQSSFVISIHASRMGGDSSR